MVNTGFSKCLTSAGWKKKTPQEIKDSLISYLKETNSSFEEFAADLQNNLLDTAVPVILEIQNMLADTVNSYAPGYANDFMWELLASSLNLKYRDEVKGQVTLLFKGNEGVYIPKDTEVGSFKTSKAVTIGTTGEVYVTAYSESETEASANSLTTINATIDDSLTVTNPSASIAYTPKETNEQLKLKAQQKLRNPRIGGIDYALARLKTIDGVNDKLISFNFIQTSMQQGIEVIIGGGDDYEIATVLAEAFLNLERLQSSPSDDEVDRKVVKTINYYGSPLSVEWTRPKKIELNLQLSVSFRSISVFEGKLREILQSKLEDYINNRKVGLPLNKNTLDGILFEVLESMDIDRMYLQSSTWKASTTKKSEENEESISLTWDNYNYLNAFKKDCYGELKTLSLSIVTA